MDKTLNDYINRANEILNNILYVGGNTNANWLSNVKMTHNKKQNIKFKQKNHNELKHMLANIEKTLQVVKDAYESIHISNENTEYQMYTQPVYTILKYVNVVPMHSITNASKTNISWIPEINQYSIKINNMTLYGNIGNIYDKRILMNTNINAHHVTICANGNNCQNILATRYCKFWHDPVELLELKNAKIISDEYYYDTIKLTRNFSNTSWIYSSDKTSPNKNIRTIGSKDALYNDIIQCNISDTYKTQIKNIKAQVMHDLLILLVLNEHNLA